MMEAVGILDRNDFMTIINSLKADNKKLLQENENLKQTIASVRKNCKCSEVEPLMEVEKSPSVSQQSASSLGQGPKQLSTTTIKRKSSNLPNEPFKRNSRMPSQSPAIPSTSSASAAVVKQSSSSSKSSQKMAKPATKQIEWLQVDDKLFAKIRRPSLGKTKEKPNSKVAVSNVITVTGPKKKPNINVRNDNEKGSVSHFPGGYHIVWKGGSRGSDLLHGPNGFIYSSYVDSRCKLAAYRLPSDHGAYWRCSARGPNGNICGFLLLEKDGAFKEISLAHKHDDAKRKKIITCKFCP